MRGAAETKALLDRTNLTLDSIKADHHREIARARSESTVDIAARLKHKQELLARIKTNKELLSKSRYAVEQIVAEAKSAVEGDTETGKDSSGGRSHWNDKQTNDLRDKSKQHAV